MNETLNKTAIKNLCLSLKNGIEREADTEQRATFQILFNTLNDFLEDMVHDGIDLALLAPIPGSEEEEEETERDETGFPIHYQESMQLQYIAYQSGVLAGRYKQVNPTRTRIDIARESWEQFASNHTFSEELAAVAPEQYQAHFLKGYQVTTKG